MSKKKIIGYSAAFRTGRSEDFEQGLGIRCAKTYSRPGDAWNWITRTFEEYQRGLVIARFDDGSFQVALPGDNGRWCPSDKVS